jgi:hypothetical protein
MMSLTELTGRQIAIEQTLTEGGYVDEARACRVAWKLFTADALPALLDDGERLAAYALAHPRRFVIPAGEPLALAEVDARIFAAPDETALLSKVALAGCQESRLRARLAHRALRRTQEGGTPR